MEYVDDVVSAGQRGRKLERTPPPAEPGQLELELLVEDAEIERALNDTGAERDGNGGAAGH